MNISQRSGPIYRMLAKPQIYDALRWILAPQQIRHVRAKLQRTVHMTPDSDVLEVGCGTGLFAVSQVRRYVGLDIDHECLISARNRTNGNMLTTATAVSLPFPAESFDLIYSVGLYHHLSDDQVRLSLQDCRRCLRPGGQIVILDAIWPTQSFNLLALMLRKIDRGAMIRTARAMDRLVTDALGIPFTSGTFYFSYYFLEGCALTISIPDARIYRR